MKKYAIITTTFLISVLFFITSCKKENGALPSGAIAAYNRASNNLLRLEFWDCDISNNNGTDIYAYGAWSAPLALLAGTNNRAEIYLHGLSANATVVAVASVPAESAGTNVVNVFRN